MKHFILFIALTFFGTAFGQKIEFSTSLNSGLFSFDGFDAGRTTFIQTGPNSPAVVGNPIGSKGGICYGLSFNLKAVSKNYFVGVDIGYEMLRSRRDIDCRYDYTTNEVKYFYDVKGAVFTYNSFLNANPFIGYRYKKFDLTAGVDIGYSLMTSMSGYAKTTDGTNYTFYNTNHRGFGVIDFRPRFQLSVSLNKKIGVYFGYAYGITNLNKNTGAIHVLSSKITFTNRNYPNSVEQL
jgi:hypothetical protein